MEQLQKTQLFESINSFINEIELSFDIPNLNDIKNYITLIENDNDILQSFIQTTHNSILPYNDTINKIISNKKNKGSNYTFMNDITLFNELLSFSLFSKDNKNTKKQLLKYIYEIYSSCSFLLYFNDPAKLQSLFNQLYNTTKPQLDLASQEPIQEITPIVIPQLSQNNSPNTPNTPNMGDFPDFIKNFMNNNDIMNIAQEITSQIDHEQFNPTDILFSLMSGNITDGVIGNLITKVQSTIDQKINDGTIDKDFIDSQATSIMEKMNLQPE